MFYVMQRLSTVETMEVYQSRDRNEAKRFAADLREDERVSAETYSGKPCEIFVKEEA